MNVTACEREHTRKPGLTIVGAAVADWCQMKYLDSRAADDG